MGLRRAIHALGEEIFPTVCVGCRGSVPRGEPPLCRRCAETVERLEASRCPVCARRYVAGASVVCGTCSTVPRAFARASAFSIHGGAVADAIARFKYGGEESLARPLGALVRAGIEEPPALGAFDCVIPVQLHIRRLRARGFNQAMRLAEHAQLEGVRIHARAMARIRDTPPQAGKNARERLANVAGAFAVRAGAEAFIRGARVLLVDDVLTTGSTANECARVLRHAGAASVLVAVVSRAE